MDKYSYTECKICGALEIEPSHFWKEHHIKESDYCLNYDKRFSKLTGKIIFFKNRESYFSSDFNDKNELKKWLKENPEEGKEYALELLEKRFAAGKAFYAPSQVELRSLCSPNVLWYQKHFNYNLECAQMGFKTRFLYNIAKPLSYTSKPLDLVIDTREQTPWKFDKVHKTTIKKVEYGDYSCNNSKWSHVFIERKNLTDFINTISGGYDRFCREIERAAKDNNYLVILVESSINDALGFDMLPHVSKKIKANPAYIFHKVRALMQKYPNIQFAFADGRVKAVELVEKIYSLEIDPTTLDLQYLIDSKAL